MSVNFPIEIKKPLKYLQLQRLQRTHNSYGTLSVKSRGVICKIWNCNVEDALLPKLVIKLNGRF